MTATAAGQNEFELVHPPSDGISSVKFSSDTPSLLLVASWDTTCRLYDARNNVLCATFNHDSAVLDGCFSSSHQIFSGGLDKTLRRHDINTHTSTTIGEHEEAIRCVDFNPLNQTILSGSWDTYLKVTDPRSSQMISQHQHPGKIFTMTVSEEKIIVGTAGRHVWIWDSRNMQTPIQQRESSLKYQTRCIRAFPNGQGYVLSSIEGRVAVEYFDPNPEIQKKKYAFKCHRGVVDSTQTIYPVNALAFHPTFGTFATGGCDGLVNVWDGMSKKRLCQFHAYPSSIASLSFNSDGSLLAIASSYTFEQGEKDRAPDTVVIRHINDAEVKPK